MVPVIRVDQISEYVGQEVVVKGWVYNRTDKGKLVFLLVRDGYGFIQCVAFRNDLSPDVFERISHLSQESAVVISGPVRADPRPLAYPAATKSASRTSN